MPEKELLEQFHVSICEFDSSQWSRNGFIDPINRGCLHQRGIYPRHSFKSHSARIRALRTQF